MKMKNYLDNQLKDKLLIQKILFFAVKRLIEEIFDDSTVKKDIEAAPLK